MTCPDRLTSGLANFVKFSDEDSKDECSSRFTGNGEPFGFFSSI
jgi:hypothetical protein